jgi:hypothetical protein
MEATGDAPVEEPEEGEDDGKLENAYLDPSLQVQGRKRAADGGSNRMFKLTVSDGLHTFECIEYQHFFQIK